MPHPSLVHPSVISDKEIDVDQEEHKENLGSSSAFRINGFSLFKRSPIDEPHTLSHFRAAEEFLIKSLTVPICGGPSCDLSEQEIQLIKEIKWKLQIQLKENYANCAIRAAVSSFLELYKNSKDAGARQITISFKKLNNDLCKVEISDDGEGFSRNFLSHFTQEEKLGKKYPALTIPLGDSRKTVIPYCSDKLDVTTKKSTLGGSGLGLYYLALMTQCDPLGECFFKNKLREQGVCITLLAGFRQVASFTLEKITNYRTEKGKPPVTPEELLLYCPPPPTRPDSPVPR